MCVSKILASALLLSAATAVHDTVDLKYSQYKGQALANGLSQWMGIRFAAPPIGDFRFMPPQEPPRTQDVQLALTVSWIGH